MGRFIRGGFYFKLLSISTTIIATVLLIHLFTNSTTPSVYRPAETGKQTQGHIAMSVPIPNKLDFCGEAVPLDRQEVQEALDRELLVNSYWHSQTILFIKRANRDFPELEKYLKENQLPDDFKYLCTIESSLMPRAISPAGAAGYWQILDKTAKELGLEVNEEVDERYHLEKSTRAAATYLKKAHARYGNWTLSAASYNGGFAGIQRQTTRQKVDSYYDLLLGEETGRYVFRILAIKAILENPENYGFYITPQEKYQPIASVDYTINASIEDIAEFAIKHGTSYKTLKNMNPWLRQNKLTNPSKKSYTLKMPVESKKFITGN